MKIIKIQKSVFFANVIEEQMGDNGMDPEWRDSFNPVWDVTGLHDHLVAIQIYAELFDNEKN